METAELGLTVSWLCQKMVDFSPINSFTSSTSPDQMPGVWSLLPAVGSLSVTAMLQDHS